jgi:UDP-N-acetylmuramoyl-tripeptide--D-alanyl-D-alanine ligase
VLNADDPLVRGMASRTEARVTYFGQGEQAAIRAENVVVDVRGRASFTLRTPSGSAHVSLKLIGAHAVENALAAAAAAYELGLPVATIAEELSAATPASRWRMEVTDRPDGVTVVNDAYNANPDSMRAAFQAFDVIGRGRRRFAVIAALRELGEDSGELNTELGRLAGGAGLAGLIVAGPDAEPVLQGARAAAMETAAALEAAAQEAAQTSAPPEPASDPQGPGAPVSGPQAAGPQGPGAPAYGPQAPGAPVPGPGAPGPQGAVPQAPGVPGAQGPQLPGASVSGPQGPQLPGPQASGAPAGVPQAPGASASGPQGPGGPVPGVPGAPAPVQGWQPPAGGPPIGPPGGPAGGPPPAVPGGFGRPTTVVHVSDAEAAAAQLAAWLRPGDAVLIKGPRAMGLERTAELVLGGAPQ